MLPLKAQEAAAVDEPLVPPAVAGTAGRVEAGVAGANLTGGNRSWRDAYLRGHHAFQPGTVLNWELGSQGHFGQRGTLGAASLTHVLSPQWHVMVGLGGGEADFQNRYRGDIGVYRKWGERQQWVTSLLLMRSASNDRLHKDTALTAAAAYYSTDKWVGEAGLKFNHSTPGAVNSQRVFAALSMGEEKKHYLTVRLDHGKEAYLPAGAVTQGRPANVRFTSTEATVQWRQWISPRMGYVVGVQGYRNRYYHRVGANVGVFFDY
ncbi:MAG: YaiO family outer membrane beta-barrel protein [Pseudomonadota bacterium]|nr:YaiO family outer membrane beta-barrel protein [Pseudomonadota bacterium]